MYARGAIFGLTRGAGRAHIVRATLESIALQSRDVAIAMEAAAGAPLAQLRVDGGAAANNLLMQIQADMLGRSVMRPACLETTALGAAYLAGLGAGVWPGMDTVAEQWRAERAFSPTMDRAERDQLVQRWERGVARAKGWVDA
jgi:glycerol kinase